MTDYTRSTGSSGTMMIRDTGSNVEFWINSNNGTTWSDHIPWSGTVNNTNVSGSYSYPAGSGWRRVGVWGVGYNQYVTFKLGSTGTGGFGGPTTLGPVYISRATVPPAPNPVVVYTAESTSMHVAFSGNGDGGSTIFIWQIGYGSDPNAPQAFVDTFDATVSSLTPGTTYYFWARGQNAQGFGPWSTRSQATTLRVPDAPSAPVATTVDQVSATLTFTPNGDGGSSITGYQIGYAPYDYGFTPSNPTSPTNTVTAVPTTTTVSGLSPGLSYQFWARAQNAVGWSPWSSGTIVTLVAGAYVNYGLGVWRRAVPYVKVSGVWKVARSWGRVAGTWRETL